MSFSTSCSLLSFAFTPQQIRVFRNASKIGEIDFEINANPSFSMTIGKDADEKEEVVGSAVVSTVSISTNPLSESLLSLQ